MSTLRLYRTVILFIMHFIRDIINLPHLYTPIDFSKSLNTTPVNKFSYKTKNSINPLTTYNYFYIPAISIVVVHAIHIPLNYLPFYDMTNESLPTDTDTENNLSLPLNIIHDFDHIDHSTVGNIDPDTHFLSNIKTSICNYYTELSTLSRRITLQFFNFIIY